MSSIYITEPPTNGKVLLTTTRGEIEIELWSREAPKACRNFVQLCLEGYYVDSIFHRIVKDFVIQGGDPTGTGTGGQSIFDDPFVDEFHSRLKYNRRGLVGMANNGTKHDNGSQFFITLNATPELQGRNTLFGRIAGDTIYNVTKIGNSECEEDSERPLYPPRITKTEVIVNPYSDIVPRTTLADRERRQREQLNAVAGSGKSNVKAPKKNKKLLSFDDDGGGDEDQKGGDMGRVTFKGIKGKSSHDVLKDDRLVPSTPRTVTTTTTTTRTTTTMPPPPSGSTKSIPRKRKMTPPEAEGGDGQMTPRDVTRNDTTTSTSTTTAQLNPSARDGTLPIHIASHDSSSPPSSIPPTSNVSATGDANGDGNGSTASSLQAQITALTNSLKRKPPLPPSPPTTHSLTTNPPHSHSSSQPSSSSRKSYLEELKAEYAKKAILGGRKSRVSGTAAAGGGGSGGGFDEAMTAVKLESFRNLISSRSDESTPHHQKKQKQKKQGEGARGSDSGGVEGVERVEQGCGLHLLVGCESCKRREGADEDDEDGEEGWFKSTLGRSLG